MCSFLSRLVAQCINFMLIFNNFEDQEGEGLVNKICFVASLENLVNRKHLTVENVSPTL